jgi:adenosylcobinamide kinase/adenosylcobinamide-phosphate guanylyltransferase
MASITLITGGAASGKSRWAISYFRTCDNVLYMSTSPELQTETLHRLEFSNKENNVKWELINNVTDPVSLMKDHKFFILDDLGGYVSNTMRDMVKDIDNISKEEEDKIRTTVVNNVIGCMNKVEELNGALVIITIEPGFSVMPLNSAQTAFRDIMGFVNQRIANTAQEVYLSVSGIQFKIK